MAKNILFDNVNYQIDEAKLAAAKEELQSHFSTVMNGSGAAIKFGGSSYNIDATKLGSAKADFVGHLGTISGSGRKVKVGSVEYGIDNTKTADAVEQIKAVLGDNIGGGSEPETPTPSGTAPELVLDKNNLIMYTMDEAADTFVVYVDGVEKAVITKEEM